MDPSSLSASYLMPDWRRRMLEDHEHEASEVGGTNRWPVKILRHEGRRAVWNMSSLLGAGGHGVPGQACRMLERYLARQMRDSLGLLDTAEWEEFKRTLACKLPLLIASCVQLAAKMSSAGVQVSPGLVRARLLCRGIVYALDEIVSTEYQVLRSLDFRVPLWTSVELAQMLALEVGFPMSMMEGVALVVDITECRRDRLNDHVRGLACLSPPETAAYYRPLVHTLHLCAGAVVASARYLAFRGPAPETRLAKLARAPLAFVTCLCDVILAYVLIDDLPDLSPTTHKRKRSISPEY